MKVALDLDGVLAQTYDVAFRLMDEDDEYGYEDIEDWAWGGEMFGQARFLSAMWHAWTLRPHEIEPMEHDVSKSTSDLYELCDQLDVVSSDPGHLGVKDSKRSWLDEHDISYDRLHISPMGGTKADFDYDVYIDDNPHMPRELRSDQRLLLRDAPYNQEVAGDYHRVKSLPEAYSILEARPTP